MMVVSGLDSFIHKGPARPSTGRIPKKIVADESAYKGHKYASIEPSDQGSHLGAFSTDLGSYPDTSTNDTQQQFVIPGYSNGYNTSQQHDLSSVAFAVLPEAPAEDGATVSRQQGSGAGSHDLQEARNQSNNPAAAAAVAALVGPGNAQEFAEFDAGWKRFQEDLEDFSLRNETANTSSNQVELPLTKPSILEQRNALHRALPVQVISKAPTRSQNQSQQPAEIDHEAFSAVNDQSNQPIVPTYHRFRTHQTKPRADNIYKQQSRGQIPPVSRKESLPASGEVGSSQNRAVAAENLIEGSIITQDPPPPPPPPSPPAVVSNNPVQAPSIQDQWKLKRKASLSAMNAKISNNELLALSYSTLEKEQDSNDKGNNSVIEPKDLNNWISSIVSNDFRADEVLAKIARLSNERWTELGDSLAAEQRQTIQALKEIRSKKRQVSEQFEQEVADMMKQVDINDGIVEGRLRNLRAFGAQMLGRDSGGTAAGRQGS